MRIRSPGSDLVVPLRRLKGDQLAEAGGKAVRLALMANARLPVPEAFCVTTQAFFRFVGGSSEPWGAGSKRETGEEASCSDASSVLRASSVHGPGERGGDKVAIHEIRQALHALDAPPTDGRDAVRAAGAEVRRLLAVIPLPVAVRELVLAAWREVGESHAYAVRSSAIAEDQTGASFAGQHDTFLNVRGADSLLEAIRQCWISLFSDRAVLYRNHQGTPQATAAMAVIVQRMVPAEAAGVLFTCDPVTGAADPMVLEAVPGLGEALVSGKASPTRMLLDRRARKVVDISLEPEGTAPESRPVIAQGESESRRRGQGMRPFSFLLSPFSTGFTGGADGVLLKRGLIRRLAKLAETVERLFGGPQDIEWAVSRGQVWLLQSRPITARPELPDPEPGIWTSANAVEALPGVVPPMSWSLMEVLMRHFLCPLLGKVGLRFDHHPLVSLIAGRAYLNLRLIVDLASHLSATALGDFAAAFGGDHAELEKVLAALAQDGADATRNAGRGRGSRKARASFPLLDVIRSLGSMVWLLPYLPGQSRRIEEWGHCVNTPFTRLDPATLTDAQLADHGPALLRLACQGNGKATWAAALWMGFSGVGGSAAVFWLARRWLDDADGGLANRLLAGAQNMHSAENGLALWHLATWARAHPDVAQAVANERSFTSLAGRLRDTVAGREFLERWQHFLDEHGHQARGGMDVARPRWSETPDYVLDTLRVYLRMTEEDGPIAHQARTRREREVLWVTCRRRLRNPIKRGLFTFLLRAGQRGLVQRENVKNEGVRLVARVRRAALEAGKRLVDRGVLKAVEDVFFLRLEELGPVLRGGPEMDVAARVEGRKAEARHNRQLDPPPIVVGRFDLDQPAPRTPDENPHLLRGVGVSPGVVTGRARVILSADPDTALEPGEILVAPWTDPGWTPYFLSAAGLVVDVGGLLSHGSVVAREYGLPAVVNVGSATKRIQTGQLIRVDGHRGTVTLLESSMGEPRGA